jgi:diacylglycerol kinase (ATP)
MSCFGDRLHSFRHAFRGLAELFRRTPNAQIHLVITVAVLLSGWFFGISTTEWIAVLLCIGLVLAAESFNSALENLTDLASPEIHPLAGKAKDLAAAAVLLGAMVSVVIGAIIFLPKLSNWLFP